MGDGAGEPTSQMSAQEEALMPHPTLPPLAAFFRHQCLLLKTELEASKGGPRRNQLKVK